MLVWGKGKAGAGLHWPNILCPQELSYGSVVTGHLGMHLREGLYHSRMENAAETEKIKHILEPSLTQALLGMDKLPHAHTVSQQGEQLGRCATAS